MYTNEPGVLKDSDYYIHTAGELVRRTFFYPVCVGYFRYEQGYHLSRSAYDSFLAALVKKGEFYVDGGNGVRHTAREGQIIMLDCYVPHVYGTSGGGELLWLHLDGPMARQHYELIAAQGTPVITLKDTYKFEKYMNRIYQLFRTNATMKDVLLSQYITTILTELLTGQSLPSDHSRQSDVIEETVAYINEHLTENLTLDMLAKRASLSPYYFTRLFKKETGFTPHEYLIAARINMAKFLLKNSAVSVKEICFCTGFSNESSFCTTFKKWIGLTPSDYRSGEQPQTSREQGP